MSMQLSVLKHIQNAGLAFQLSLHSCADAAVEEETGGLGVGGALKKVRKCLPRPCAGGAWSQPAALLAQRGSFCAVVMCTCLYAFRPQPQQSSAGFSGCACLLGVGRGCTGCSAAHLPSRGSCNRRSRFPPTPLSQSQGVA